MKAAPGALRSTRECPFEALPQGKGEVRPPLAVAKRRNPAGAVATVRIGCRYAAAPPRVFDAWLDPQAAAGWLFATATHPLAAVAIDARPGGAFAFVDRDRGRVRTHAGRYLQIERPRVLSFTLVTNALPQIVGRVTVHFTAHAGGCALALAHTGVPPAVADHVEGRWSGILYGLGLFVDGAPPTYFPPKE